METNKDNTISSNTNEETKVPSNFIRNIVIEDLKNNKNEGRIHTRFPPEPNGYLHIGHAKSICLNFGIAREYNGLCNLRFDDTNPETEETQYVESIQSDIKWLGFDWEDRLYFASDYFDKFYEYAQNLIKQGKAYVCELNDEQIREYRGTVKQAGKESPYRNRPAEESLDLLKRMKEGKFPNGKYTLRAKIDMSSSNMKMRDPLIYRIRRKHHYRTGDKWAIYPMYDYAHCLSDSIEGITHSLCTLEFDNNRELYDWFINQLPVKYYPRQIEFARLNLTYTMMSKRKLLTLVEEKHVSGWDDPRMPTIAGFRRRGYTPSSLRTFIEKVGVAKSDSVVDIALLEYCLRTELNATASRFMAVLNPIKVTITNYPEKQMEYLSAVNNPEDESQGTREIPFSRNLYIEREDFREDPPKKFFRLGPGREVRLRYAYFIKCEEIVKDEKTGEITELLCTYDPETKGGSAPDNRKVKATLHWVSADHAIPAEVRLYDHLFNTPNPGMEKNSDFRTQINPDSETILTNCQIEPALSKAEPGTRVQFERHAYFIVDPKDSSPDKPVFIRSVTLKDTWAKIAKNKKENQ